MNFNYTGSYFLTMTKYTNYIINYKLNNRVVFMNRIEEKFNELKQINRKALITFLTAGDPTLEDTIKL